MIGLYVNTLMKFGILNQLRNKKTRKIIIPLKFRINKNGMLKFIQGRLGGIFSWEKISNGNMKPK